MIGPFLFYRVRNGWGSGSREGVYAPLRLYLAKHFLSKDCVIIG